MASEQFSLCWDNFHRNMSMGMQSLLENEDLVDVTLAIEGRCLKAHKMVLSVCSPYFRELFQSNPCKHPIVFMKDVSYVVLMDLLQFMYQGEVQVAQENLSLFIKTAEALQIKGLTGDSDGQNNAETEEETVVADTDNKKTTPSRPKKFSGPASKKPKLNPSTHVKTLPVISSTSKFEVTSVNTNSEVIEDVASFKPEPGDSVIEQQSDNETMNDSQIDQYADYANADDNADDGDDFSMADSNIDEPKASTSTDIGGGSDNQDRSGEGSGQSKKKKMSRSRIIFNGFVYHTSVLRKNPAIRYLICAKYGSAGCHARAVLPLHGTPEKLRMTRGHNHPPDDLAEEKFNFLKQLKEITQATPNSPLKVIFEGVLSVFPRLVSEVNYDSIKTSMRRWRKEASQA